ncbi:DUF2865 domain-containing protein [Nitratireductor sp. ZSWI3]|uniref:DUF2865 domain-containing protein n=1 Tax=Nitratireductor sp. ZSWI3 TaxID=2966359 RepID=UPI00214FFF07|nr:DUF2865 domain-containing protein [Nitratireductor sp. ZSWI3]MCR4266667.1 DUF2865 domain-containing protein [Nitratireductor sp. ZSWI3]
MSMGLVVWLLGLSASAAAQTQLCRNLASQLQIASRGGSAAQISKLQGAIARQNGELSKVRGQMRTARCGFGIFGNRAPECTALRKSASSMERNVLNLRSELDRQGQGNAVRDRNHILATMRAKGCDDKPAVRKAAAPTPREKTAQRNGTASTVRRPGEVFQTMCVRSCDGYYFPISFSVSRDMFARDEKTCQARCPGSDVKLYAHNVLSEESEDMISVADGAPYRELPNAFLYRQAGLSRDTCSCRPDGNTSVVAAAIPDDTIPADVYPISEAGTDAATSFYIQPTPSSKDTVDNAVRTSDVPPTSKATPASGVRRVRVVGPKFLPAPEEAIDLRVPAQPRAR